MLPGSELKPEQLFHQALICWINPFIWIDLDQTINFTSDALDQNIELNSDKLKINSSIKENLLLITAKWTRFLAIIGFIFVGIMGIASLILLITSFASSFAPLMLVAVIYMGLTIMMVFPALYLTRFAVSTEKGLNSNKQGEFDYGIQNMKSLFKFAGIYTIVIIVVYIIYILVLTKYGVGRMF